MLEGKYLLKMETPIGEIKGNLQLYWQRNELCGILEVMGNKNYLSGGKAEENKCAFTGDLNTPVGKITYQVLGILNGEKLDIYVETNKGRFKIDGTRVK